MASSERAAYPLGRDFLASLRLYLTHYMWKSQLGFILSPQVPRERAAELRVADVACGTAQWLIDLAKELPSTARLDGFDISNKQFPHPKWLPANVTLSELDMVADLPAEYVEAYDVVHVGLIVTIARGKPEFLLKPLLRMLKPGGYLQWDEMDLAGFAIQTPDDSVGAESMTGLNHQVRDKLGLTDATFGWVRHIDDLFKAEGVETLANKYHTIEDSIARPWTLAHLVSFTELKPLLEPDTAGGGPGLPAQQQQQPGGSFWERFSQAANEAEAGATTRVGMVHALGRKSA